MTMIRRFQRRQSRGCRVAANRFSRDALAERVLYTLHSPLSTRPAFISVGAVCQRLSLGGVLSALRRGAAGRLNSSLRSHRTGRSYCRPVCSGLNKTLYASVGPNSRCRGHRRTLRAKPWSLGGVTSFLVSLLERCPPGRIKAGRGHRRDAARSTNEPRRETTAAVPFFPSLQGILLSFQGFLCWPCQATFGRLGCRVALAWFIRVVRSIGFSQR